MDKGEDQYNKLDLDVGYLNGQDLAKQPRPDRENGKKISEDIQKSWK